MSLRNKMEKIASGEYTTLRTISSEESNEYYLIPEPHCIAIPVCATAGDTYQVICTKLGDWALPEKVSELPKCTVVVLRSCLPSYTIAPVLREILVAKPVEILSPMQEDAIREAKKRQSYISTKKQYITGNMEL